MTNKTTAAITTACVGLAAATCAYMVTDNKNLSKTMHKRTKHLRKSTGNALHQIGDFIDNVSYMMK